MTRSRGGAALSGILLALTTAPCIAAAQLGVSGTAFASLFMHQVDIGYGVEKSTGVVVGVEGALHVPSRLVLAARASGGSLSTQASGAENRDVGEIGVRASVIATRWLAFVGGATSRTYTTSLARQRWTTVELGAEARVDFAAIPARGVMRGGVVPVVSVRGLPGPSLALTGAVGLEYRRSRLVAGLFYGLERYDFPAVGTVRRLEQVSTLTIRFAVQRGGGPLAWTPRANRQGGR